MKIIENNKIYVQKKDIKFLNTSPFYIPIPSSLLSIIYDEKIREIDDVSKNQFIEFSSPEEINFFQSIDWIINYDEIKDLGEREIFNVALNLAQNKNDILSKFSYMSKKTKIRNANLLIECDLIDFKIYSLKEILAFKKGLIQIELPKGVKYPNDYAGNNKNIIKKLVKRMNNKKSS